MKKIFIILFFVIISGLNAQELFFCESYSDDGDPIGHDFNWEINPWGSYIYILYKSPKIIEDPVVYLFIDKETDGHYEPFDSKAIPVEQPIKWLAYNYKFSQPGKYEIYFMNSAQKMMKKGVLKLTYRSESPESKSPSSTKYYDKCEMIFCERVIAEKPLNNKLSMSLRDNNGQVYVYLRQDKPMNTNIIRAEIWKKGNNAFEYDEYVGKKKFKVESNWTYSFFKYTFTEPGEYKIIVLNDADVTIKSGFFTVYK
jgi:hypothetical protein